MGDNCGAVAYPIAWSARTKRASQHILYTVAGSRGSEGWGGGVEGAYHKAKAARAAVAVNFVKFYTSICRILKTTQANDDAEAWAPHGIRDILHATCHMQHATCKRCILILPISRAHSTASARRVCNMCSFLFYPCLCPPSSPSPSPSTLYWALSLWKLKPNLLHTPTMHNVAFVLRFAFSFSSLPIPFQGELTACN